MSGVIKGLLHLLALVCLSSMGLCMPQEETFAESLNYCATLKSARGNYVIINSDIPYGKWTEGPGTSDEIPPPTNKIVYNSGSLRICSSGRAFTPSGTEASIVLVETSDRTNSQIKIYWDIPLFGSFNHTLSYNQNIQTVVRKDLGSGQGSYAYEYTLLYRI